MYRDTLARDVTAGRKYFPCRLSTGKDSCDYLRCLERRVTCQLKMGDKIKLYVSTVTGSVEIRKQQLHVKDVLDGKKVEYDEIDISASSEDKDRMRELCGDRKALPPQIFRGDKYLGDYEAFSYAVEDEKVEEFLSK